MVVLVSPSGDFPLNDDWVYGKLVKILLETGKFQLNTDYIIATTFTQVYWGALFCLPFGFSFTALRFSTLTLGLVGILTTYCILREAKATQITALIGALIVAVNPLYFGLSNTFMTDVPFFTFAMLSFLFFIRGIRRDSNLEILFGTLLACAATLTRQLGVVIPLSFGVAYLFKNGISKRTLIKAFLPPVLVIGILTSWFIWLLYTRNFSVSFLGYPRLLYKSFLSGFVSLILHLSENALISFIYLGLFLFPFLILLYPGHWKVSLTRQRILSFCASSFFLVAVIVILIIKNQIMPLLSHKVLFDFGLGSPLLLDVTFLGLSHFPTAPIIFWPIITGVGVIGGALLFQYLFLIACQSFNVHQKDKPLCDKWLIALAISAWILYFVPFGITQYFDRYLLFLLPLALMIIVADTINIINFPISRLSIVAALIVMVLYGVFSVGATHDYLSWNRARWRALHDLMQKDQISPHNIDGGYEFNGWYTYNPEYQESPDKSWYWVDNDDYIITFGPVMDYEVVKVYPFRRWFPWGQGNIFVLHKNIAPLDQKLAKLPAKIKETFLTIRHSIFQLGKDIEEKLLPWMICYFRGGEGIAWFDIREKKITLYLRKGEYLDKYDKTRERWNGYPVVILKEEELDIEHIEYLIDLLRQAYKADKKVLWESKSRTKDWITQIREFDTTISHGK